MVMANDGTALVYAGEPLSNVGFTDISQLGQVGSVSIIIVINMQ